jgi:two-component system OmpR family response regulator
MPTVMIIDDDPDIATVARRLLEKRGFSVIVQDQPFSSTALVMRHKPDVVLLDVNMPALSGDRLATVLSRHSDLREIAVVLFSSNDEQTLRQMALRTGAAGYISKSDIDIDFAERVAGFVPQPKRSTRDGALQRTR